MSRLKRSVTYDNTTQKTRKLGHVSKLYFESILTCTCILYERCTMDQSELET